MLRVTSNYQWFSPAFFGFLMIYSEKSGGFQKYSQNFNAFLKQAMNLVREMIVGTGIGPEIKQTGTTHKS